MMNNFEKNLKKINKGPQGLIYAVLIGLVLGITKIIEEYFQKQEFKN
jgi:F0F1-type ATP synthase assembly protein I